MRRVRTIAIGFLLAVTPLFGQATIEVEPLQPTIGERIAVKLTVEWSGDAAFEPPRLGPEIGSFTVLDGGWSGPSAADAPRIWSWSGHLAAYRTGATELPPLRFSAGDDELFTDAVSVSVVSVLDEEIAADAELPEIADLKSPLGVAADFTPLLLAAALLLVFLALAAVAWWLHRRYGQQLTAVAAPADPFHRVPPHEWVYAEIQKLLARQLPEKGQVDLFYAELSWILKRYLSGRYRVELMEHTTDELPSLLEPAALGGEALDSIMATLREADRVKFAKERPDSGRCKASVEMLYAIVDATKPAATAAPAAARDERGAA